MKKLCDIIMSRKVFIRLFLITVVIMIPLKVWLAYKGQNIISDAFAGSLLGFAVSLIGLNTVRSNKQDELKNDPNYKEN